MQNTRLNPHFSLRSQQEKSHVGHAVMLGNLCFNTAMIYGFAAAVLSSDTAMSGNDKAVAQPA